MPTVKFTDRKVSSLKPVEGRQVDYWDQDTPGLGLRVSPGGTASWVLKYRTQSGAQRRLTLGRYPELRLGDARDRAREHRVAVIDGGDPARQKQRARKRARTVADLAERYVSDYAKPNKRSWREDERILRRDVLPKIGDMDFPNVSREEINALLRPIVDRGSSFQANRTFATLRKMFNWAVRTQGWLKVSPCADMPRPTLKEPVRERELTDNEIREIWRRTEQGAEVDGRTRTMTEPIQIVMKLLLMTGQRLGEVSRAIKSEFDLEKGIWLIPGGRTKNGKRHEVHLTEAACQLVDRAMELGEGLDTEYLFPNRKTGRKGQMPGRQPIDPAAPNHALRRVLAESEIVDVRPHDFREAVASGMARLGVPELHVGAVLNHTRQSVTAKHYNRHTYGPEKQRALEAWSQHLLALVGEEPEAGNVVQLNNARSGE